VQFFSSDDVVGAFLIIAIMDFPEIAVQNVCAARGLLLSFGQLAV
jgi:hypothetical protein